MMISKKNIEAINELYLHDMELLDIKIDYFGHKVEVLLYDKQKIKHILLFEHMQNFSITGFEPWGEGMYVNEVKTITSCIENLIKMDDGYVINEDAFMTEILLNSGDRIEILSSKIQFV